MVRFLEGLVRGEGWCGNSSGSRPNFFGDSTSPLTRGGKNVVRSEGEASNPSGSRPNFFGRQHLTFDKGGKGVGGFRGIIVFLQLLWEWQYSVQREEQARQGCLSVCAQVLCKDAKPTKHTQTLILRKASGIVRFWKGWWSGNGWCGNPSGSRPNFFGDSTSPLTRGGKNVVRSEGGLAIPPVVARIFSATAPHL